MLGGSAAERDRVDQVGVPELTERLTLDQTHPLARLIGALARGGRAERLALGPLSLPEARALACQIDPATSSLSDTLLRRAGGNPFLTEGLLHQDTMRKPGEDRKSVV